MLQLHLELDQDLTRFQPPQVPVVNHDDGNVRIVLLTTAELFWQHQAIEASFCCTGGVAPSALCSNNLQGSDFRVSDRYRCLADHRGQVQGGVGFIYEGIDLVEGSKVCGFVLVVHLVVSIWRCGVFWGVLPGTTYCDDTFDTTVCCII